MQAIFDVYLANASVQDGPYEHLTLPAPPYRLLDTLERLRLGPEDELYFELEEYHAFEYLASFLEDPCSLYQLNALAETLSGLDRRQSASFEGLLGMEVAKKKGPITIHMLYDLACNTECCHVVGEVLNDIQLGRFYAEHEFLPQLKGLPEELFEYLDFDRLGREMRVQEGGIHTSGGYVIRHSDLVPAPPLPDSPPQKPDYAIRFTLTLHPDAAQGQDAPVITLDLPATQQQMQQAQEALGTEDWFGVTVVSVDSPLTAQADMFHSVADMPAMNRLAQEVERLSGDGQLTKFKALLCALDCADVNDALRAAETLNDHILDVKINSPEELAENEIDFLTSGDSAELLKQHIDHHAYGKALLAYDNAVITPYGFLLRDDFQPIQDFYLQPKGGMEMK